MKSVHQPVVIGLVFLATAMSSQADIVGNVNWADEVAEHSANIQNYGGTLMTSSTEFWATGAPDADADENGYAWDAGDLDYVAGWRSNAPGEYIVLGWDTGIADLSGDDLEIHYYGGPSASASVYASVDGVSYTQIGTLDGGTPGYLQEATFDFAGLFSGDVRYVKVERIGNGPNTGMFFDAFGGTTPEPSMLVLLAGGATALLRRKRRRV